MYLKHHQAIPVSQGAKSASSTLEAKVYPSTATKLQCNHVQTDMAIRAVGCLTTQRKDPAVERN